MVDYAIQPRGQRVDENGRLIQGGTTLEFQLLTCTVSNMQAMNFTELPKSVMFDTRTGTTDVEFVFGTSTVPVSAAGGFWTIRAGIPLAIDIANTGTFYFRNSAANQNSLVIGMALL